MLAYSVRRILLMIPTLFAIILVNFVIVQAAPGGPVDQLIARLKGADTSAIGRAISLTGIMTFDGNGNYTFSGQITVTAGTGRFQSASGIVSFSGFSKNNSGTGNAVYSFKGVLHM